MKTWKKAYEKMRHIAGEAIALADAYAGGESENAESLNKQYEKLDMEIDSNPPQK